MINILSFIINPVIRLSAMNAVNRLVGVTRVGFQRLENTASAAYSRLERSASSASRQYEMLNRHADRTASIYSKLSMITGGALTIGGVMSLGKSMVSEAASMESYRLTLETTMKSAEKARETLSWATAFANVTPFETGDIVEGTVRLANYGLVAQNVLPRIGDMAAIMGKSINQGVEAIADAQTGELERLKEFGITKNAIAEKAQSMFKGMSIINNKGQITDLKKFNEALFALMSDRFAGGMEKSSRSFKGLWSTIIGVSKTGMAQIAGITAEGEIVSGSLFDIAKQKAQSFADTLQRMQEDGTFNRWMKETADNTKRFISIVEGGYQVVKDYWGVIKFLGMAYASYWVAVKIAWGWTLIMQATLAATGVWTTMITLVSMATTGYGLQTTAIYAWELAMGSAAVTAGILTGAVAAIAWSAYTLYKRWDDVKVIFDDAGESVKTLWDLIQSNPISKFLLSDMNPLYIMLRSVSWAIQKMLDVYNLFTGSNVQLKYETGSLADMIINNRTQQESMTAGQSSRLKMEMLRSEYPKVLQVNMPVTGFVDPKLTERLDMKVKEGVKEYQREQAIKSGDNFVDYTYNSKFTTIGGK